MVDTITYYTILDAKASKYNIENYKQAIYYTALTSMRAIIGEMTLDELLSSRDSINKRILAIVDAETDAYGIKVISCEIKNINLPDSIKKSMEQLMTSKKDKEAKITKAEGDKISAIESAEGEKKSSILQAQGQQEAILLEAEAEAKAIEIKAQAEAKAIETINKAIINSGTDETVIALKQIEALIEMSKNPANKLILPTENMNSLGNISAIAETLNLSKENK